MKDTTDVCLMEIIVNGKRKPWYGLSISFEHLVMLAFGNIDLGFQQKFTVTYAHGLNNKSGSLLEMERIETVMNMIFNISVTNQS